MANRRLLSPEEARQLLSQRFVRQHRDWLVGGGAWPLTLGLGPPTEKSAAEDAAAVRSWADAWAAWGKAGKVVWEERRWPRLGAQPLPVRLQLDDAADVASVVGEAGRWQQASARYRQLAERWPVLAAKAAVSRHFEELADYPAVDFDRLLALLVWLEQNPASDLYLRQLPVEGMHTKWIERRTRLVCDFVRVLRGEPESSDIYALCGLKRAPHRLRLRLLCKELRQSVGGLGDVEAPVDSLARLPILPTAAIIVENLETGLALPERPGTVALMKLGHAVSALGALPWLRQARVVYWGDIDTHGFVILDRARQTLPSLKSVLMDEATLLAYRDLCGEEQAPHPETELPALTPEERAVYEGLRRDRWGRQLRLEQERLPWKVAWAAVAAALSS
jgi:hypothetical protein